MLGFATPAALIALAALALPIALHLWSRRTGRPQHVGSIAFFAAAPPPATRHPRLDDLWLLLLRCAILAALALALAGPYWRSLGPPSDDTWALVDSATAADSRNAPLLDSLRSAGAEMRVLGGGSLWSRLREADFEAPRGTRFVVVAPNRGAQGDRPTLRAPVEWIVPPADPGSVFLSAQRFGAAARTVLVYSDAGRREDARYLTAALRVAAEATGQPAVVTQRDAAAASSDADWIVWLAGQQVPDELLARTRRGAVLLTDALADAPQDAAGHVRLAAASDPDATPPRMRRRTAAPTGDAALWTDDAGLPVLTLRREGAGLWLTFHSRFHPSWGDLVLHPAFPEAIAALWAGDSLRTRGSTASVAVAQILPARATTSGPAAPARADLYHVFWLAGVLLFLAERLVARRARMVPE